MAEKHDPVITENETTRTTAFIIAAARGILIYSKVNIKGDYLIEIVFHGVRETTIKIEITYIKSHKRS